MSVYNTLSHNYFTVSCFLEQTFSTHDVISLGTSTHTLVSHYMLFLILEAGVHHCLFTIFRNARYPLSLTVSLSNAKFSHHFLVLSVPPSYMTIQISLNHRSSLAQNSLRLLQYVPELIFLCCNTSHLWCISTDDIEQHSFNLYFHVHHPA